MWYRSLRPASFTKSPKLSDCRLISLPVKTSDHAVRISAAGGLHHAGGEFQSHTSSSLLPPKIRFHRVSDEEAVTAVKIFRLTPSDRPECSDLCHAHPMVDHGAADEMVDSAYMES